MRHRAFTLIELLVVIAIIAILAAILFPVFMQAKRQAKVTTCLSNSKQVGLAVRMYVDDNNGTWPIFFAYNSQPPAGKPGHMGIEVELYPYVKDKNVFGCPEDVGSPYQQTDVPGTRSYLEAYGTSRRYDKCAYSVIADYSTGNNQPYDYTRISKDSMFVEVARTRVQRDEMFPFFSWKYDPDCSRYGYDGDGCTYFRVWHATGGTMIFGDGHAKFITSMGAFDATLVDPAGHASGDPTANGSTWYWACD
jgi:prepilin-type N-terminal cleavage/methylation domain-containing protein